MKKIFTLLTMALLAVGASAQTMISWNEDDIASAGTLNGKTYGKGFVLSLTDTGGKISIDANSAFFGTAESQTKFTHRLKTGGTSSSKNYMKLTIPSEGKLRVYARTGSNSATDRNLVLMQDSKELYNAVVKEADAVKVKGLDETDLEKEVNVYPIIEVDVVAGEVEVTYPTGSMNFYGFEFTGEIPTQQAVDPVFALTKDEIYTDEASQIIVEGKSDLDGLTMSGLSYDSSVITIDETGKITPVAAGTSIIEFTTAAVDGEYNAGSANLSITVKEVPAAPEFGQWNFSDEAFSRYSSFTEEKTIAGLTLTNGLVIDESDWAIDGYSFTNRLKLNSSATEEYRSLNFTTVEKCNITIYVKAGGDQTRNLIITKGSFNGETLYSGATEKAGSKISLEDVEADTKIYVYADAGVNIYAIFVTTPAAPHAATTWDFTQELSAADASNLESDNTNWTFVTDKDYWENIATLVEGRNVFTALKANGEELDIAKGITFARDDNAGLKMNIVRIAPSKFVAVNGGKVTLKLDKLAKDDVIRLRIKGAGDSERSLTPANATVTDGSLTTADTEVHEVALKTTEDGSVTFTTTNGFQFLAIAINDDLPEYTGISVINAETESAADAPVYNLEGKRVDENYRGVVIKNGKKMIK